MEPLRASLLAAEAELGSRDAAWRLVLAVVAAEHGLGETPAASESVRVWREPGAAELLGSVHESVVAGRGSSGTFYTPPELVAWVLDRALDPLLDQRLDQRLDVVPDVLDPACGSGAFLLPVLRRVTERLGVPAAEVVAHLHGVDLDPVAVAITRLLLRIEAPDAEPRVRVGDGLGTHHAAPFDLVVGNPPFLGQLRTATRASSATVTRPGAYTDTSALFLRRALDLVRPGGRVALVQPLSVLSVRDADPVRRAVAEAGAVTAFWASARGVFAGTDVPTCVPVVQTACPQAALPTWHGPEFVPGPPLSLPVDEWGPLAAPALGIPSSAPPTTPGVLGDLGPATADFRDQYYGLAPYVSDGGAGAPLITSGLIDPAACRWGSTPTRFHKTRFTAPTVDVAAIPDDDPLAAWAARRLVPKVLVATQGRVIEAVVDVDGAWLPSVPVVTLAVPRERLWHALAVLLSPPIAAYAAARYLGSAMSPGAIKLSAKQVAALPLPGDVAAWDEGARLARAAQGAPDTGRRAALAELAAVMCRAYDDDAALTWWLERLPGTTSVAGAFRTDARWTRK